MPSGVELTVACGVELTPIVDVIDVVTCGVDVTVLVTVGVPPGVA